MISSVLIILTSFISATSCVGDPTIDCGDYGVNYFGFCDLGAPIICADGNEYDCVYYDDITTCGECIATSDCEDLTQSECSTIPGCSWQDAPTASFTATPTSGLTPLTVSFDGTASADSSNGYIVSYEWDFGDGNTISDVMVTSHTYSSVGAYVASLVVTDNQGATNTAFAQISSIGPPGVCYGDATFDCSSAANSGFYGCDGDVPTICGDINCHTEYDEVYDREEIFCDCANVLTCSDLGVDECSTIDGCSFGSCGDGVYEAGEEECDDGCMEGVDNVCELDVDDGDGCSSSCEIEAGWTCTGSLSVCEGDLILDVGFEGISGNNIFDNSGFGNNLIKQSSTSCGEVGVEGVACSFDNTAGEYIMMTSTQDFLNNNLGNFTRQLTVSAWVKPTAYPNGIGRLIASNWYAVGGSDDTRRRGWLLGDLWGSEDHIQFCVQGETGGNAQCVTSNGFFSDHLDEWVHVVGVFKGGDYMKIYINGVSSGELNSGVKNKIANKFNIPLMIGHAAWADDRGMWDGFIDEIKIYSNALTQAEITTLFDDHASAIGDGDTSGPSIGDCTETDDGTIFVAGITTFNGVDSPDECIVTGGDCSYDCVLEGNNVYDTYDDLASCNTPCSNIGANANLDWSCVETGCIGGESTSIIETSCNALGQLETNTYTCPGEASCLEGACDFPSGGQFCEYMGQEFSPRTREEGVYCSAIDLQVYDQKALGVSCNEDYECESNACLDEHCTSIGEELEQQRGILQRIYCLIVSVFTSQSQAECLATEAYDEPVPCTDTDAGWDPMNAGTCYDGDGEHADSCVGALRVSEFDCNGNTCVSSPVVCNSLSDNLECRGNECVEKIAVGGGEEGEM